jgi:hypothetical protein
MKRQRPLCYPMVCRLQSDDLTITGSPPFAATTSHTSSIVTMAFGTREFDYKGWCCDDHKRMVL